jgi:FAD/FMN-containing dehydrogenase
MARALHAIGGHARLFRGTVRGESALPAGAAALAPLWQRLRLAFDPSGILNPGLAPAQT